MQGGGGNGGSVPETERMGPGIDHIEGAGMECMARGLGHHMDCVGSEIQHMGLVMDHMGSLIFDHRASSIKQMGQTMEGTDSGMDYMGSSMGFSPKHMAAPINCVGQTTENMGSDVKHMGPAVESMGFSMEHMGPTGWGLA